MAAADSLPRSGPATGVKPGLILAFLCLGQFMVFLDVSIVNLALPSIQDGLDMSDVSLNYIVTAYSTVLGGFLLLSGRLRRHLRAPHGLLMTGFVVFAVASLTSGLAQNAAMLITSRGFQGLGSSMIAPAALSILTNTFPEGAERNKALGVWGSLAGIASIVGVMLGGVLADGPGWEWIFWINVPIGLGVVLLAPRILPESKSDAPRQRFDFAGAGTLTAGLLLLIFTLGEAINVGWGTARTIGSLIGVAVLLIAFLVIETKVEAPMMPLRIFRLKTMRVANFSAILVFGTFGALFFFASLFMQQAFGYSPMKAGFAYVPLALAVAVGAGVASGMITKMAARPVLAVGLTLTTAGLLILWRTGAGELVPDAPAARVRPARPRLRHGLRDAPDRRVRRHPGRGGRYRCRSHQHQPGGRWRPRSRRDRDHRLQRPGGEALQDRWRPRQDPRHPGDGQPPRVPRRRDPLLQRPPCRPVLHAEGRELDELGARARQWRRGGRGQARGRRSGEVEPL